MVANIALILAGGTGSRMGSEIPKQFLTLSNSKEIIVMSIDAFESVKEIDKILIVCHANYLDKLKKLIDKQHYKTPVSIITGGNTRQESSFIGLKALKKEFNNDDIVLIHDAARPFVSKRIILENIKTAKTNGACTTVIPTQDTLIYSNNGNEALYIPDRSKMYSVQTPQTFRLSLIYNAHKNVNKETVFTDDSGILLTQDVQVSLVIGDKKNIKITSYEDIKIANSFI